MLYLAADLALYSSSCGNGWVIWWANAEGREACDRGSAVAVVRLGWLARVTDGVWAYCVTTDDVNIASPQMTSLLHHHNSSSETLSLLLPPLPPLRLSGPCDTRSG